MKKELICPKCQGRTFYAVETATIPAHDSVNGAEPLTVAAAYMKTGKSGLLGDEYARYHADVEAWVCASCGYTELYTTKLQNLRYMVKQSGGNVRFVDATATKGAFR